MSTERFTIYCHVHAASGRRYVGQTKRGVQARWKQHLADAKKSRGPSYFGAALLKYGKDAFASKVLEVVDTQEAANVAEAKWIAHYDCQAPNGFNLAPGGHVTPFHELTKKKMSANMKKRFEDAAYRRRHAKAMSDQQTIVWASKTPQERRLRQLKVAANLPPEKHIANGQKLNASMSSEVLSARARKRWEGLSDERKVEIIARATTAAANLTPEQHRARMLKSWATRKATCNYGRAVKPLAVRTPEPLLTSDHLHGRKKHRKLPRFFSTCSGQILYGQSFTVPENVPSSVPHAMPTAMHDLQPVPAVAGHDHEPMSPLQCATSPLVDSTQHRPPESSVCGDVASSIDVSSTVLTGTSVAASDGTPCGSFCPPPQASGHVKTRISRALVMTQPDALSFPMQGGA
jgi:hypothetical protein